MNEISQTYCGNEIVGAGRIGYTFCKSSLDWSNLLWKREGLIKCNVGAVGTG